VQALELVIFAALAAVVLFQLYTVLGRRVGRQPEDAAEVEARRPAAELEARRPEEINAPEAAGGLAALRQRDPSFDVGAFLSGARSAYEMIVLAFSQADRGTLKNLLTPQVYGTFEAALDQREAEGRSETTEFLHAPRADLEDVKVAGETARVKVRFLAEVRTRSKGPEGEAVDDRRTAEIWTFERNVTSRDPNWSLAQVEPAEV
jgi:predicted lipid-binding transport protein (Tim44 family)